MKTWRWIIWLTLISVLFIVGTATAEPLSNATYLVTFESTWSDTTHPSATFPTTSAHWSSLVGVTHSSSATFWEVGGMATAGVERIAETGDYRPFLNDEVASAITAGTAAQSINAGSLGTATGLISTEITVDPAYPLVTLLTMIAPSPDWFAGVANVSLLDADDNWINSLTLPLPALDAGTDNGTDYLAINIESTPHQPIRDYTGVMPFSSQSVGTMTFTLLSPEPTAITLANNSSHANISSTTIATVFAALVLISMTHHLQRPTP